MPRSGRAASSWLVPPALPGLAPGPVATRGGPAGPVRTLGEGLGEMCWQGPPLKPSLPGRASSQWVRCADPLWEGERPPALRSQSPSVAPGLHGRCCWSAWGRGSGGDAEWGPAGPVLFWVTQGGCSGDGFGFLQQTDCFNEEE